MCKGVAAALHRFPRARTCIIVLYEMHLRAALFAIGSPTLFLVCTTGSIDLVLQLLPIFRSLVN